MKLLLTLNMAAGDGEYPTHQIILDVREETFGGAMEHAALCGWFMGEHMIYEGSNPKIWKKRGTMAVNVDHVGKVAEYYEGGKR